MERDAYLRGLQALMPQGGAWPRDPEAVLTRVLSAMAAELAAVDDRGQDLVREVDPRTTLELLPDWERVTGLPDPCTQPAESVPARRARVVQKLTARGGQSKAYYIAVAKALGFTITITEFRPFRAGSAAGEPVNSEDWWFVWRVDAAAVTINEFRASANVAGDALRWWGNAVLECVLNRLKPAHTLIQFAYGG